MEYIFGDERNTKTRKAFLIVNNKIVFKPPGSSMSNYDFAMLLGITSKEFSNLIRGYYLDGHVVFYKGNYMYDDELIKEALTHLDYISRTVNDDEFDIYFGVLKDEDKRPICLYGKYKDGVVTTVEEQNKEAMHD
jgi:hypothetical protein